jgi:hypothetical protein
VRKLGAAKTQAESQLTSSAAVCSVCGRRFPALGRALRHEIEECGYRGRCHLLSGTLVDCDQCEKSFCSRSRLQQHCRLVHAASQAVRPPSKRPQGKEEREAEKEAFLKVSCFIFLLQQIRRKIQQISVSSVLSHA